MPIGNEEMRIVLLEASPNYSTHPPHCQGATCQWDAFRTGPVVSGHWRKLHFVRCVALPNALSDAFGKQRTLRKPERRFENRYRFASDPNLSRHPVHATGSRRKPYLFCRGHLLFPNGQTLSVDGFQEFPARKNKLPTGRCLSPSPGPRRSRSSVRRIWSETSISDRPSRS